MMVRALSRGWRKDWSCPRFVGGLHEQFLVQPLCIFQGKRRHLLPESKHIGLAIEAYVGHTRAPIGPESPALYYRRIRPTEQVVSRRQPREQWGLRGAGIPPRAAAVFGKLEAAK